MDPLLKVIMPILLHPPSTDTEVLFIHAPYPGTLRFEGQPSSLLHAATPFLHRGIGSPGLLDPGNASDAFFAELEVLLARYPVRALCVSTSTVAIEQTARIVGVVRHVRGQDCLVIVGGPHDDGCAEKVAHRMPGVDLSIAGRGEHVLDAVLTEFVTGGMSPGAFCRDLPVQLMRKPPPAGDVTLTSPWWGKRSLSFEFGKDHAPRPRAWTCTLPRFAPFGDVPTLPLMVSRGCSYGRCTFCAEASRGGVDLDESFEWVRDVAAHWPGAPLYFQDSIFPGGDRVRSELLPILREFGRPWGAQVYLPLLTERRVHELADAGCTYLYTGVETAAESLLLAVGKRGFAPRGVGEKLRWMNARGMQMGVSIMLGVMNTRGHLAESSATIAKTADMVEGLQAEFGRDLSIYPNVQTVLPGTALAQGIERSGRPLDFYVVPRVPSFDGFEDGGHGYNFASMRQPGWEPVANAVLTWMDHLGAVVMLPSNRHLE